MEEVKKKENRELDSYEWIWLTRENYRALIL
jgi:hypothetical protein